jgi:mannose-6-phosphate isomerase-like protein (cupin superfamily)
MSQLHTSTFATMQLPEEYDYLAPDGSEIRELLAGRRGNMAHCVLPPGRVSQATSHRTVEEIWYCLSGQGQMWRKLEEAEEITELRPGTSVTNPTGTHFQFRNTGRDPLVILIACMPPWPGPEEARVVPGPWQPNLG